MADSLRVLRRKRRIVGEIRQITRAMKLVSAAKLKRTMATWERVKFYFSQLDGALQVALAAAGPDALHRADRPAPVGRLGLLLVAGDKGLCGAYNSSMVSRAVQFAQAHEQQVSVLTVGARAAELARRAQLRVISEYPAVADKLQGHDAAQVAAHLLRLYESGEVDQISVCYARFVSRLTYEPTTLTVLPFSPDRPDQAATDAADGYLFEPDPGRLLRDLMPLRLRAQVHELLLEAAAAEHSARLMAMSAATENAEDMLESLGRQINRARQAQITSELLDVVSGADALADQA